MDAPVSFASFFVLFLFDGTPDTEFIDSVCAATIGVTAKQSASIANLMIEESEIQCGMWFMCVCPLPAPFNEHQPPPPLALSLSISLSPRLTMRLFQTPTKRNLQIGDMVKYNTVYNEKKRKKETRRIYVYYRYKF